MNGRQPPRALLAAVAVAVPVVVEVVVTSTWWDRLPDRMATTFGPDGSPSGYGAPLGTALLGAAIQTLFVVAAVGSAFARDRRKARVACAVTAGFVAFLAISWLILAGTAASSLSSAAWWLLVLAPAWASIPYCILTPHKRTRGLKTWCSSRWPQRS